MERCYDDEECVYRACAGFGRCVRRWLLFRSGEPAARQHKSSRGRNRGYEHYFRGRIHPGNEDCDGARYGRVGVEYVHRRSLRGESDLRFSQRDLRRRKYFFTLAEPGNVQQIVHGSGNV